MGEKQYRNRSIICSFIYCYYKLRGTSTIISFNFMECLSRQSLKVVEVGFEPTCFLKARFTVWCIQPLCHSTIETNILHNCKRKKFFMIFKTDIYLTLYVNRYKIPPYGKII